MGTLVTREDIRSRADWYFSDAYYAAEYTVSRPEGYRYDWPSKDFPYRICIHDDDLSSPIKVEIRRWIEQRISETVIYTYIDKSYWHYRDEEKDSRANVRNIWCAFYFESEESAVAFKLRFLNIVKEITDRHPTWHNF